MTSLRYIDRQDNEEIRTPTRTPPDLTLLRGLRLIDSRAFDNWVWATDDEALAVVCGVRSGQQPHVPETVLLPHRIEPVLDTLRTEQRRARANEAYVEAIRYAVSLGTTNPVALRHALVVAEVRGRAKVSAIDDLVCSPKARTRRVDGPLIESLCAKIQPGRGIRKILRGFLSRPVRIRAGLNLRQTMVPLLSAELLMRIRDVRRQPGDITERVREWLDKEGRSLRSSVLALVASVAKTGEDWPEPLVQLGQFLGQDELTDSVIATAVVLRSYVEAVKGPQYEAPVTPFNSGAPNADSNRKLVLMWWGPHATLSVTITGPNEWRMSGVKHPLAPPEFRSRTTESAGVREAINGTNGKHAASAASRSTHLTMAGIERANGVDAGAEGASNARATTAVTLEQLRSVALQTRSLESIEISLEQIEPLPRAIVRDLQQAGFETMGEVLRWSSCELQTSGALSPGRQVRLLDALSRHILSCQ